MPDSQPSIGDQLGLGRNFVPSPTSWKFARVDKPGGTRADALHVVIFDTVLGPLAITFDADALRRFADQAIEQATGLKVASTLPMNGGQARRPL